MPHSYDEHRGRTRVPLTAIVNHLTMPLEGGPVFLGTECGTAGAVRVSTAVRRCRNSDGSRSLSDSPYRASDLTGGR